jgi:hypothetical protein
MKTSEHIDKLAEALAKAQALIRNPEKNATVKIPNKYTFHYADLPACFDAAREALVKNGLSHSAAVVVTDQGHSLLAMRLMHSSGQWIETTWPLPRFQDPKQFGGEITYAKRHLFTALVGIHGEDDTDGSHDGPMEHGPKRPQAALRQALDKPKAPEPKSEPNAPLMPAQAAEKAGVIGNAERAHVKALIDANGWSPGDVKAFVSSRFSKNLLTELTPPEYQELTAAIALGKPGQDDTFATFRG